MLLLQAPFVGPQTGHQPLSGALEPVDAGQATVAELGVPAAQTTVHVWPANTNPSLQEAPAANAQLGGVDQPQEAPLTWPWSTRAGRS